MQAGRESGACEHHRSDFLSRRVGIDGVLEDAVEEHARDPRIRATKPDPAHGRSAERERYERILILGIGGGAAAPGPRRVIVGPEARAPVCERPRSRVFNSNGLRVSDRRECQ